MTFKLQMQLPVDSAEASIKKLGAGLTSLEGKADKVGKTFGAAMGNASGPASQATGRLDKLAQGWQRVADQIAREKAMLDQIRAPQQEYFDKMMALDKLLERNAITTKEYAEQITNLNSKIENTPQPKAPAAAPSNGAALASFAGAGALPGALLAVGHQMEELIQAQEEMQDRYIEMTNASMKFADATHSTNTIIDEQVQLSRQLHTVSAKTIELYDGVRDATDGMNVSHNEQLRIARTLAEASIMSGKGADAATQAFMNLRVAFEVGQGQGRALSTIFKQFPDLTDHMTESLGLSKDEIVDMANKGKLGYEQLTLALTEHTETLDAAHANRKITNAEERAEMAETAEIAMNRGVPALLAQNDAGRHWAQTQKEMQEGGKDMVPLIQQISASLEEQKVRWERAQAASEAAIGKQLIADLNAASAAAQHLTGSIGHIADAIAGGGFYGLVKLVDPWFVAPETPAKIQRVAKQLDILADIRGRMAFDKQHAELQPDFGDKLAFDKLSKSGLAAQTEQEKDLLKILNDIETPAEKYEETMTRINELHDIGALSAEKYALAQKHAFDDAFKAQLEEAKRSQEEIAKKSEESAKRTRDAWAEGLGKIGGDFINAAIKGDQSFSQMAEHMVAQIVLLTAKMELLKLAESGGGGFIASLGTSILGGLGGFATGGSYTVPDNGSKMVLPHAANGGTWTVGGHGGTDSKLAMLMVSPRETIQVHRPWESPVATGGGGPTKLNVRVVNQYDKSAALEALDSPQGERVIANVLRRNPGLVRTLSGR